MEQLGAAASGAGGGGGGGGSGGEEPGVGRSNKRGAGNRAANEEETKNKPKLVSLFVSPAGLGDPRAPIILPRNTPGTGPPLPAATAISPRNSGNGDGLWAEEHPFST